MKIALFSKDVREGYVEVVNRLVKVLIELEIDGLIYTELYDELRENNMLPDRFEVFDKPFEKRNSPDLILSIGGDGTFISAVSFVQNTEIPVAGINCGRLGYLADIQIDEVEQAIKLFKEKQYRIEKRSLLEVNGSGMLKNAPLALNEVTVQKRDTSSMISVEAFINDQLLTTYWADGLIISTPTGSTAYSMSVGGPIVTPTLDGLIIIPIASHHLTVRPVIVPQDVAIRLNIQGRGNKFLASVDHNSYSMELPCELQIRKSDFEVSVVKFNGHNFYATLRNRLMWGVDPRNF